MIFRNSLRCSDHTSKFSSKVSRELREDHHMISKKYNLLDETVQSSPVFSRNNVYVWSGLEFISRGYFNSWRSLKRVDLKKTDNWYMNFIVQKTSSIVFGLFHIGWQSRDCFIIGISIYMLRKLAWNSLKRTLTPCLPKVKSGFTKNITGESVVAVDSKFSTEGNSFLEILLLRHQNIIDSRNFLLVWEDDGIKCYHTWN